MTLDEAFARTPSFTTRRLVLRPMAPSDAEAIFEIKGDPEVTGRYAAEPHATLERTRRWVEDRLAGYLKRESIFWVYTLKGNDRVIGICCYWHFDEKSECAEIGYELGRAHWHQGITTEALAPVLEYGFDGMGLNRIEACPYADNAPSNKVLQNLGFRFEGALRQRVKFKGRFIDQHYYSLLRGELRPPSGSP